MKVVLFIENRQCAGLDTFCRNLVENWPNTKDEFHILCNESHPGIAFLTGAEARHCRVEKHSVPISWVIVSKYFYFIPEGLRRIPQPFLRIFLLPIQIVLLRRRFINIRGDALMVLNGGYPGGETCRVANIVWRQIYKNRKGVKNVHNFHNYAVPAHFGFRLYEQLMDWWLSKSVSGIISVSQSCAKSLELRSTFKNYPKLNWIYNGISRYTRCESFPIPNVRSELGIGESPICIMLGTYEVRKGHEFLFKSFSKVLQRIPNAHLLCCGGGSEFEIQNVARLKELHCPSGNVHLLGFIPNGYELIDYADVVVISSQYLESFGLTAIEAMSRRKPVIATRVGGLPEVLGDPEIGGYLVDPSDSDMFAKRIIELLESPADRMKRGIAGEARFIQMFHAVIMAKKEFDALKLE
jgi:glycosyltransferase involved in cell wall biosynthesis